jgi:hypothetical protein
MRCHVWRTSRREQPFSWSSFCRRRSANSSWVQPRSLRGLLTSLSAKFNFFTQTTILPGSFLARNDQKQVFPLFNSYQNHRVIGCVRRARCVCVPGGLRALKSRSHGRHVARGRGIKLFRLLNILPHISGKHCTMNNWPHSWRRTAQPGKLCLQIRTICFGNPMYGLNHGAQIYRGRGIRL